MSTSLLKEFCMVFSVDSPYWVWVHVAGRWSARECGHVQHADRHLWEAGPLAGSDRGAGHGCPSGVITCCIPRSICAVLLSRTCPDQHLLQQAFLAILLLHVGWQIDPSMHLMLCSLHTTSLACFCVVDDAKMMLTSSLCGRGWSRRHAPSTPSSSPATCAASPRRRCEWVPFISLLMAGSACVSAFKILNTFKFI